MWHIIKKDQLTSLWAIEDSKPNTSYFLSYCDAEEQYNKQASEYGDEWAEYNSITKIEVVSPVPTSGRMWFAAGQYFSCKGDALEISENPELVEVTVV